MLNVYAIFTPNIKVKGVGVNCKVEIKLNLVRLLS